MPNSPYLVYWDACVFLSYINGEQDRLPQIDDVFREVERSNDRKIVTSAVSKVEVAFAFREQQRVIDAAIEAAIDALWSAPFIELVEFHDFIALDARSLIRRAVLSNWSLKPLDSIHLATAKWIKADVFHTYDERLERYADDVGCTVCQPQAQQPQLPGI